MSRRLNFTGRKRIRRDSLGVQLERVDASLRATISRLDLAEYALPADAEIYLEIYHQTFHHRVHCGTVGTPSHPQKSVIEDFGAPELLKCRVLVVEKEGQAGKVLALADRVPVSLVGAEGRQQGLLATEPGDLGSLLWRMDMNEGPRLLVNESVDWKSLAKTDWFRSVVFPEALRRSYLWVVSQLKIGVEDDELLELWIRYFEKRLDWPIREDAQDSDLDFEAAADEVMARFAEIMNLEKSWPSELSADEVPA